MVEGRSETMTRRGFLRGAAVIGAFMVVPRRVLGGAGHVAPSEMVTVGCVGMGGQGHIDLFNLLQEKDVRVVAVCDVHREGTGYISWDWMQGKEAKVGGREPARRLVDAHYGELAGGGCRGYADYRELLEREDVDAVVVATPDHTHAVVTMAAIRRGKHVYCEKPLAYTVEEVRRITEAARAAGVATQLGNQGQASEEARLVQEFIMDGAIGAVREVHITVGEPFWARPKWGSRPAERPPVPGGLDWDLWLGPAPERPYHPAYHPWTWRDWRDFGTGMLGDMGCHKLSTVFKALKLGHPVSVEGWCEEIGPEVNARVFEVTWEFGARGDMPPVVLRWFGGGKQPPRPKGLEEGRGVGGEIYIGDEGVLMGYRLVPESRQKEYGRPPRVLERSPGQYREWIDACRGGAAAGSDFVRHSGLLTETPLLGNIAMRAGKKLLWDGAAMRFTNDEAANERLRRVCREGWAL
ncbi:MAG TPA: Gfo/Idh/MocA family oxidoreductase [Anaerohalosphaeraceae bacterium]|jgi:predicted dehydrogenase|nr:Gfo/Idh/MocA family oxidoreductase [Anaerohalosphaeraceae bacterium]HRT49587.1 Gfo/Idh/MocA family oxidoreductase [Anaerohalosphaeraceae bacterium]HRT85478.1 Gfo/Idh/MocA family oxidoreductase [Anaerohalosphaeraceae bacterium]